MGREKKLFVQISCPGGRKFHPSQLTVIVIQWTFFSKISCSWSLPKHWAGNVNYQYGHPRALNIFSNWTMHPFRPFNSLPALERTLCSTGGEGLGEGYDLRRGGGGRKRRWLIVRECPKVNALKKGNYVDQLFNAGKLNNSAGKKPGLHFFHGFGSVVLNPWFRLPGFSSLVSNPWFRYHGFSYLQFGSL